VLGVLGLMGMAVAAGLFLLGSVAVGTVAANEPDVPGVLSLVPAFIGLFLCAAIAISTVPSLVAGYGLVRRRPWARVWTLIAGIVNLPGFPLGTLVGVYAIWIFVRTGTNATSI
jgi:hypothetical protein